MDIIEADAKLTALAKEFEKHGLVSCLAVQVDKDLAWTITYPHDGKLAVGKMLDRLTSDIKTLEGIDPTETNHQP